jgi:hypothetical protein
VKKIGKHQSCLTNEVGFHAGGGGVGGGGGGNIFIRIQRYYTVGRELAGGAGRRGRRGARLEPTAKFAASLAAGRALWAAQGRAAAHSSRTGASANKNPRARSSFARSLLARISAIWRMQLRSQPPPTEPTRHNSYVAIAGYDIDRPDLFKPAPYLVSDNQISPKCHFRIPCP